MVETKKCKVIIFDDEPAKANDWQTKLVGLKLDCLEINVPSKEQIQAHLDVLYKRRDLADANRDSRDLPCALDDIDVLIVDFDLRHLSGHRGFATGEEIAYAARVFSAAKSIIVVNHPNIGLHNFDLTLQKDRELRGDVYLGHQQLVNPGLWRQDRVHDGFLPWSWPVVSQDADGFLHCINEVSENFDRPILGYFGLDQAETRPSPEMLAYLGIARDGDKAFSDPSLLKDTSFVRPKDVEGLLRERHRHVHVVTALLRKWFRRWVMPAQTLLADLPHIALALPWAVKDYANATQWDHIATCGRTEGLCKIEELVLHTITDASFNKSAWTGRPAYFARAARRQSESEGVSLARFDLDRMPKIAFAEDLSRFVSVANAIEYEITLDGQAQLRRVSSQTELKVSDSRFATTDIVYSPQSLIL